MVAGFHGTYTIGRNEPMQDAGWVFATYELFGETLTGRPMRGWFWCLTRVDFEDGLEIVDGALYAREQEAYDKGQAALKLVRETLGGAS